jgi:hypothetical protein
MSTRPLSQPSSQTLASSQTAPSQTASTVIEVDSDDDYDINLEEIPKDDHYIDFAAQVVGVQYYDGVLHSYS